MKKTWPRLLIGTRNGDIIEAAFTVIDEKGRTEKAKDKN